MGSLTKQAIKHRISENRGEYRKACFIVLALFVFVVIVIMHGANEIQKVLDSL